MSVKKFTYDEIIQLRNSPYVLDSTLPIPQKTEEFLLATLRLIQTKKSGGFVQWGIHMKRPLTTESEVKAAHIVLDGEYYRARMIY